jgi:pyrimidine-specific ribonucleoside hydrolase
MLPVILDVDTGVDDALALLVAARHPDLDLLAVSCVAGNAGLEQVVENTLRILDVAGAAEIPVAAGARRPLIAPARSASHVHGSDGLGGIALPASERSVDPGGAVEMLRRVILGHPEPVTVVALAPQTNLALLLRTHPEVADNIRRIVFMGGSASGGNATAVAEFNVWHDPEAAAIVLDAGVETFMYGLDVFTRVAIPEADADELAARSDPLARTVGELLTRRVAAGPGLVTEYTGLIGDAGAVCALVDPDALRIERLPVSVELAGTARGQTLVDRRTRQGEDALHGGLAAWPLVDVALEVDERRLAGVFLDALGLRAG